jgi:hypothetical protein
MVDNVGLAKALGRAGRSAAVGTDAGHPVCDPGSDCLQTVDHVGAHVIMQMLVGLPGGGSGSVELVQGFGYVDGNAL